MVISPQNLEAFLRRRVREAALMRAIASVVALATGILATFVTFWVVYGAIWWGFQWCLPHSHQTRLVLSAIFLVIVFVSHARMDRDYLASYKVETVDGGPAYTINIPHVGILSNLNFFSPNTVHSLAKVIVQLLFIAPQLLSAAWRFGRRSMELSRINVGTATHLAERLSRAKGRVPFAELSVEQSAESLGVELRDLVMLDAIQFLESRPPGVMLTSNFREALNRWGGGAPVASIPGPDLDHGQGGSAC